MKVYMNGFGYYAPKRVIGNAEMTTIVDTTDEWIQARTGIKERHIVAPGETCSDMGMHAATQALEAAGMKPEEIDIIMCATISGDSCVPTTATRMQQKLGIRRVMAFDFNAACSGYIYGLDIASNMLSGKPDAKILVLATEVLTSRTNWADRTTCVLFGDGAGAAVMSTKPSTPIPGNPFSNCAVLEGVMSSADGSQGDLLLATGGSSSHQYKLGDVVGDEFFIKMNGREVYKHAVRNMPAMATALMDKLGYTIDDIDVLIPHQANMRIIEAVGQRLGVPTEKVFVNVHKYGNTSCASIPLALGEAL
ncbi:MAG: ketoacyl-ACP synthase III, partial [Deltaproteobacteria bacterium]|nr:ketoacyl-ACP synthase III [Deltaproteobacteria bacterium]